MPEKESCRVEIKKMSPYSFGIFLYKNGQIVSSPDIVEAIAYDGHFSLAVRGNEPFEKAFGISRGEEVRPMLYTKANEIAEERLKQNYYCL